MKLSSLLLQFALPVFALATELRQLSFSQQQGQTIISSEKHHRGRSLLLDLHKKLCVIDSTTGQETEAGEFLVGYLESLGLTVDVQHVHNSEYDTERFNVYAYLGKSPKTKVLLSSHIDTVPPYIPYSLKNNNTEIWGRGTVDAKGSVAAQVAAFEALRETKEDLITEGSVGMLFVVGEEKFGDGMKTANNLDLAWDSVIFGEPTEGKLVSGHKGIVAIRLVAIGKATHSGYPWLGASANKVLVRALTALDKVADAGGLPRSDKYGNTTANIGQMKGGVAANVVPEHAEATLALRLASGQPNETTQLVLKTLRNALSDVAVVSGSSNGTNSTGGVLEVHVTEWGYAPVDIDHDIPGFNTTTVNYGTDIPNLKGNHKRYLYGPGSILVAHSNDEHLTVSQLEQAVVDYQKIILHALNAPSSASMK